MRIGQNSNYSPRTPPHRPIVLPPLPNRLEGLTITQVSIEPEMELFRNIIQNLPDALDLPLLDHKDISKKRRNPFSCRNECQEPPKKQKKDDDDHLPGAQPIRVFNT